MIGWSWYEFNTIKQMSTMSGFSLIILVKENPTSTTMPFTSSKHAPTSRPEKNNTMTIDKICKEIWRESILYCLLFTRIIQG